MLDNLSGGRVEIGLGQGYRPAEFEMFGWSYARRTTAFEEALDILGLAWRGERFDYEGRIYKVRAGLLRPPPVRPLATSGSNGSSVRVRMRSRSIRSVRPLWGDPDNVLDGVASGQSQPAGSFGNGSPLSPAWAMTPSETRKPARRWTGGMSVPWPTGAMAGKASFHSS